MDQDPGPSTPLVSAWTILQPLEAVSMEPSPVLSPGLSAEAQVLAASSCTPVDLPLELGGAGGPPGLTVLVFLLSACDSLAAMLCSEPLKLPIYPDCHLSL